MTSSPPSPDQIIADLGGCGRYQWLISTVSHFHKCLICWAVSTMIIVAFTPPWSCDDEDPDTNITTYLNNTYLNTTYLTNNVTQSYNDIIGSNMSIYGNNDTKDDPYFKACKTPSGRTCKKYRFEGYSTLVSEFGLVCDDAYIPSLIMSIQSAGSLLGNLMAGQISDLFGRKRPYFGAMLITVVFSIVGYLANNWILFAVSRFMIGLGGSSFLTTMYSLLSEFTLAQYRAWIIGVPTWGIETCLLVFVAWLIKDWRYIPLATAILGVPCLLSWWIIHESFRWHLSHDRPEVAERILRKVAKMNKKPLVTAMQLRDVSLADERGQVDRKYTILDIFASRYLIKVTILMAFTWLALGFVGYGVQFGIQTLSGNVYLNIFLFSVSEIPSKYFIIWLANKIGRRKTSMLCFLLTAVGGYAAGIVHYIDTPKQGALVNGFAFLAHLGVQTARGPIQTMTIELYPTVIRSIGFGTLGILARVGGIIAPQFVFLSTKIPGIMFLICGVLSTFSMVALLGLNETRNTNLNDKITQTGLKEADHKNLNNKIKATHIAAETGVDEANNSNLDNKTKDTEMLPKYVHM